MRKILALLLCFASFIYTVWYMHFGIPYKNSGALSKIGLEHKALFVIWGVLTFAALSYSLIISYGRYLKLKLCIPFIVASAIGMILTLSFDFEYDVFPDYYFHCGGSLLFSVSMGAAVFIFFLLCYKKGFIFKLYTYITGAILLIDFIALLIFKETALIEALPIFAAYFMLLNAILRRDKLEIKQSA